MKIGGFIGIRNGINLDYPWELAVNSLLSFCDEVVICDSDSSDGTREKINAWEHREPRITVANFPWKNPVGDPFWWPEFLNYARCHLKMRDGWAAYLDADEIWSDDAIEKIREAANKGRTLMVKRLNFWGDAKHLIPEGHCCGFEVIRVGPQHLDFPSDYPWPGRTQPIESLAERDHSAEIFHYGFIRKREAFFRKAREVSRIWNGGEFDPRLANAETYTGNWADDRRIAEWVDKIVPFTGKHPKIAVPWLRERGYAIADDGTPL